MKIRVEVPSHLRTLGRITEDVVLEVGDVATQRTVLDALELRFPVLKGTIRDQVTFERRPFMRFFACEEDLSHDSPDTPLPNAVAAGAEPFWIIGAIAGGRQRISKGQLWTGRVFTALSVLFLLMDAGMKIFKAKVAVEGTVQLGYSESVVVPLGLVLLLSTLLYAIPRTTLLGAILLTGYLGGAVDVHVRIGNPLFTHVLFPVYIGVLVWGGLYLRDGRFRDLLLSEN